MPVYCPATMFAISPVERASTSPVSASASSRCSSPVGWPLLVPNTKAMASRSLSVSKVWAAPLASSSPALSTASRQAAAAHKAVPSGLFRKSFILLIRAPPGFGGSAFRGCPKQTPEYLTFQPHPSNLCAKGFFNGGRQAAAPQPDLLKKAALSCTFWNR